MEGKKYNVEINPNMFIITIKRKKLSRLWFTLKYKGIQLSVIYERHHDTH